MSNSDKFIPDFIKNSGNVHSILHSAGLGLWEMKLDTNTVSWDDHCKELFGIAKGNNIPYADAIKFIHPEDVDKVNHAVQQALAGKDGGSYNMTYRTIGADDSKLRFVNFIGKVLFDEHGKAKIFGGIARDVTNEKTNEDLRIQQKANEANLKSIFDQAPLAIGVLKTRDMILETANDSMFEIWGKTKTAIGQKLIEFLPEIKGQGFIELLEEVYDSGNPFYGYDYQVELERKGILKKAYCDFVYTPLKGENGHITGIIVMAVDVTAQFFAKEKLLELQTRLRNAVETAELATWSMDVESGVFSYSKRFMEWLGFSEDTKTMNDAYNPLPDEFRLPVADAIALAVSEGSSGVYENEHPIVNRQTGQLRIIHAHAQVFRSASGQAILSGIAQDITKQKEIQIELERLVQQQTEELASANEELAAANEELVSTNDELAHANTRLTKSNGELEQYAYVASHDLQEPLRKIKTFSERLLLSNNVPQTEQLFTVKINESAKRMSLLINDLLDYSRLQEEGGNKAVIQLQEVVNNVANDYELTLIEKDALVTVEHLPSIEASHLQMNQLFHNLIGNALKFSSKERKPEIDIKSQLLPSDEVGIYIQYPLASVNYYHITVTDNGIGFEPEYSEHVFEIFKRLHTRQEYAGSGIGLAFCRRIVTNHNGVIFAASELGKGTVFHIILPEKQLYKL